MVQFNGSYKLERSENLEELLSKMGTSLLKRKAAMLLKPQVEVRAQGSDWSLVTSTPLNTLTWTFRLGEEEELLSSEGHKFKAYFTLDGAWLTQHTTEGPETAVGIAREFTDDGMITHITHKSSGVKCKRIFRRC